jgi:hypothetical protein
METRGKLARNRKLRDAERVKETKANKERRLAARGRRGRVYGRGANASWPKGIVASFIEIETDDE